MREGRIRSSRQLSLLAVALVGAFAAAWFALLASLEGRPLAILLSDDPADVRLLANTLSRTSVTLISAVFACLFLAIPLTASAFTPQLVEIFWRRPTNRLVLGLFVFSAGNAVWLAHLAAEPPPRVHLAVSFVLVVSTLVVLLPYLFSVFRLIDPAEITATVAENVRRSMRGPVRRGVARKQEELARRVQDLGNVALRMLDRSDRDGAAAAVDALGDCAEAWLDEKPKHAESFFAVDSSRFPGLSPAAIELVNEERTWVEMELLLQLARGYGAALAKAPDVISAIARALRHFALAAAERRREGALALALRYENNFMREAVKRRDLHAVYDLLHQRVELAIHLWPTHPASVLDSARRLDGYGRMASAAGMPFAHALVAHDVGRVVAAVAPTEPRHGELVERFLEIGGREPLEPGIRRARIVTAARLAAAGHDRTAVRVLSSLAGVPRSELATARSAVEEAERWFWEVTDRQEDVDWLDEGARAGLERIWAPALEPSGR